MTFALLMPAAGSGIRLGAALPKSLIQLAGEPLFVHAARPFIDHHACLESVIAVPPEHLDEYSRIVTQVWGEQPVRVVAGGETRQDSVRLALESLTSQASIVLVHDAARPMIDGALIERVLGALTGSVAAVVPGLPVADTIKRVSEAGMTVAETVDRQGLYAVQTPQGLLRSIAVEAFRKAAQEGFVGTDDVSLIEHFRLGVVRLVEGDPRNSKITTRSDLEAAQRIAAHQSGYSTVVH